MPTSKARAVLAAMHTLTSTINTVADDTNTTDSTENDGGTRAEGKDTDGSSPTNHAG